LAVLTTGRQDWGLLRPLCAALRDDGHFELQLMAGGMACSPNFGDTIDDIRRNGFEIAQELPWEVEHAGAVEQSVSALRAIGKALEIQTPDAIVLLGDRFETASAALAATLLKTPVVHLYGGEETEGAFDNSLRHAITKMSHLHFVAHETYAQRVIQMGEDPSSVHVVGSLAVDNILGLQLPSRDDLEVFLGLELKSPLGLVTVHPTTLASGDTDATLDAVAGAMARFEATWVVTLPNADPGNCAIRKRFLEMASRASNVVTVSSLGVERYLGLMTVADFLLGNSSSGMTEAPSLRTPTINVGDRQKGRIRCPSIVDVADEEAAIVRALEDIFDSSINEKIKGMDLPFGDGDTSRRICSVLAQWKPPKPPRKTFWLETKKEHGINR